MTAEELLEDIIKELESLERLSRLNAEEAQCDSGAEDAQWYWGAVDGVERAVTVVHSLRRKLEEKTVGNQSP